MDLLSKPIICKSALNFDPFLYIVITSLGQIFANKGTIVLLVVLLILVLLLLS